MLPNIPVVEIELDKPRLLRYDFGAFAAIQRETGGRIKLQGKDAAAGWRQLLLESGPDETILLVWSGILHEYAKGGQFYGSAPITYGEVAAMIGFENLEYLNEKVSAALMPVFPVPEGEPTADPQTAPTGPQSGPLPDTTSDSQTMNSGV
jgi:hypothetical protein